MSHRGGSSRVQNAESISLWSAPKNGVAPPGGFGRRTEQISVAEHMGSADLVQATPTVGGNVLGFTHRRLSEQFPGTAGEQSRSEKQRLPIGVAHCP